MTFEDIVLAYGQTFDSVSGKLVLADLKKSLSNRVSFVSGKPDETAFREGQRDVVLRIEALMARAAGIVAHSIQ